MEEEQSESPTAALGKRGSSLFGGERPSPFKRRALVTGASLGSAPSAGLPSAGARPLHRSVALVTDPVHQSMELHPCLLTVMDTPQYQRLRGLHQLGAASWVYPCATHTRFEHSIGVSHLASKLVRALRDKQPELGITDTDVLCVALGGLCHDLGHGPFSHLFDGEFLRAHNWQHEQGSVDMLRWLLKSNNIDLGVYGLDAPDQLFVEELILGSKIKGGLSARKGRGMDKAFLYDIINNERSGLDVDKLDYLARDAYMTGVEITTGVNVERIAQLARVLPDENGVPTICFPEKSIVTLFGVFHARVWMHHSVYQHKVVKAIEFMIRDILRLADEVLVFRSRLEGGRSVRMSESMHDMTVYQQLRDSVLDLIEQSADPRMEPAQALLRRLHSRDLYRCCGTVQYPPGKLLLLDKDAVERQLVEIAKMDGLGFDHNDVIAEIMLVHHGKGKENPVDGLRFYSKKAFQHELVGSGGTPTRAGHPNSFFHEVDELASPPQSQSSFASHVTAGGSARCFKISEDRYAGAVVPKAMSGNSVRVYAKSREKREAVAKAFRKWTRQQKLASPLCHNSQTPPVGEHDPLDDFHAANTDNDDDDDEPPALPVTGARTSSSNNVVVITARPVLNVAPHGTSQSLSSSSSSSSSSSNSRSMLYHNHSSGNGSRGIQHLLDE